MFKVLQKTSMLNLLKVIHGIGKCDGKINNTVSCYK